MNEKNKKYVVIGLLFLLLVGVIYLVFLKPKDKADKTAGIMVTEEVMPTVDGSVEVDLKLIKKGEASLTVENPPNGTDLIEFEITYMVLNSDIDEGNGEPVPQGAIGKCYKDNGIWSCGESADSSYKIILGTCSSGVCRYHNITGPLKVLLKFTGNYGSKIFEKEYNL